RGTSCGLPFPPGRPDAGPPGAPPAPITGLTGLGQSDRAGLGSPDPGPDRPSDRAGLGSPDPGPGTGPRAGSESPDPGPGPDRRSPIPPAVGRPAVAGSTTSGDPRR